jgi:hypothetical protein
LPFSICRSGRPSSPRTLSNPRPKDFASSPGSPTLRVWLPSRRCQLPNPRKLLSAPNAPGLRPPELFSSRMIDPESPQNLPLLRSPAKLLPPRTGAPAASSHPKSRPPLCHPKRLTRGRGSCSPGPFDLSGSPSARPRTGHLHRFAPSRCSDPKTLQSPDPATSGLLSVRPGFSSEKAPACLAFLTCLVRNLLKRWARFGLFFPLGASQASQPSRVSS